MFYTKGIRKGSNNFIFCMENTTNHDTHNENNHGHAHDNNTGHHAHHETASKMKGHAGALEAWLIPIFANVPHLPHGGRKFITDIAPWLSLIFGILGLIGLMEAGVLTTLFSPLMAFSGGLRGVGFFITIILGIASSILSILSFNPLREMKKKGWDFAFYSFIIGTVSTIVTMVFMFSGVSGIVGTLIGAYILFEVREMYH